MPSFRSQSADCAKMPEVVDSVKYFRITWRPLQCTTAGYRGAAFNQRAPVGEPLEEGAESQVGTGRRGKEVAYGCTAIGTRLRRREECGCVHRRRRRRRAAVPPPAGGRGEAPVV